MKVSLEDILHIIGTSIIAGGITILLSESNPQAVLTITAVTSLIAVLEILLYLRFKKISKHLGLPVIHLPFDYGASRVLRQLTLLDRAMFLGMEKRKIKSNRSLAATFDFMVKSAYFLIPADHIEITLSDGQQEYPQTSYLRSSQFKQSRMMEKILAEGIQRVEAETPIELSGARLGSIKVVFPALYTPTKADKVLLDILAHQAMVAILNSRFSQKLLAIKQVSEQLQQAQTGFLANLSHELRGPIGFLLNATELLEDGLYGEMNQGQLELLQMMKRSGDHLLDLMNDVLDFAKAESGKTTVDPVHNDINELLKDMVGVVRKDAEDKGHRLVMIPHQDSPTVVCDRRHIRQILINILTNAVKYTPNKGGRIEIWADRLNDGNIRIHIRDNGVGIAQEDFKKVFAPFERLNNPYSKAQSGSGIGMSLVKHLVELNNGKIDFESQVGQGTHFWVEFPEKQEGVPTTVQLIEEAISLDGNGKTIILFSENKGERTIINRYLSHIGFDVREAISAQGAEFVLERESVKLAVINGSLVNPEVEQLLQILRSRPQSEGIPVITVSSEAMRWEVKKYLRAGVDRYLAKPLSLEQLGSACCKMIKTENLGNVIPRALLQKGATYKEISESEAEKISSAGRRIRKPPGYNKQEQYHQEQDLEPLPLDDYFHDQS
jgi:signal transduction histidine kinase/DNA-binding NarL/FixJ family response regulator